MSRLHKERGTRMRVNDYTFGAFLVIEKISRPTSAVDHTMTERFRDNTFIGRRLKENQIGVSAMVRAHPRSFWTSLRQIRDEMMLHLMSDDDLTLYFSDETDRSWQCRYDGGYDEERINRYNARVTLTFTVAKNKADSVLTKIFPAQKNSDGILETTIYNDGTVAVPIDYRIKHKSANGYLGIVSQHGTAQIGQVSEQKQSEMLITDKVGDGSFTRNWRNNTGKLTEVFPVFGEWTEFSYWGRTLLKGLYFGGPTDHWHGTSKNRRIKADSTGFVGAANFTMETRLWFLNSMGTEQGLMECIIATDAGERWLGFAVDKGLDGNQAKIRLYNGETYAHIDFDTGANDLVSKDAGTIIIEKFGANVRFRFKNRTVSYVVNSIKDINFTNVTLFVGQMRNRPYTFVMGFDHLRFQKHFSADPTGVPNKFQSNDEVIIDSVTSKILHNRAGIADVIGSEWFLAPPGETKVHFYYSSFATAPEITAEIKEAYY